MADNITLNSGTGGAVVATDDIGGVQYQRVKATFGADGVATDVSEANPLPVAVNDCVTLLSTTVSAVGETASIDTVGFGAVVCQISGVWNGNGYFESSNSGSDWDAVLVFSRDSLSLQDIITSGGIFTIRPSGRYLRFVCTNIVGTMTVNAIGRAAEGIAASDLLSLAMDRSNNAPLLTSLDDLSLAKLSAPDAPPAREFNVQQSGIIPINTVLLTVDCLQLRSLSIQCVSIGTTGAVTPEWSDNNANWVPAHVSQVTSAPNSANSLINSSGTMYVSHVFGRYFRLRLSTATTAGSTVFSVQGFQSVVGPHITGVYPQNNTLPVTASQSVGSAGTRWFTQISDGTNSPAVKAGGTTVTTSDPSLVVSLSPNSAAMIQPQSIAATIGIQTLLVGASQAGLHAEISSAARTVSGNSGAILSDTGGGAFSAVVNVTAVSGTSLTLDIVLQESYNGGTWVDVYHCERLTATGTVIIPPLPLQGRRRWVWNIGGFTPSFTFDISIARGGAHPYPRFVQFFDRTAGLLNGTANATSAAYQITGCSSVTATVTLGAATTACAYSFEASHDGANWFIICGNVTAGANATVNLPALSSNSSVATVSARFVRLRCDNSGTAQTGVHASITARQ